MSQLDLFEREPYVFFEDECDKAWENLSEDEKNRTLYYLRMLKKSQRIELPVFFKNELIFMCDVDTSLVPLRILEEHSLFL